MSDLLINGPLNSLKRVYNKPHTLAELEQAVKYFLDGIDLDLDADGNKLSKQSWESDDDAAVQLLYGRMHDGVLADELGCTIKSLRIRAAQKGRSALLMEYDEDAVQMVKQLSNRGANIDQIARFMGIEPPMAPFSWTDKEKKEKQKAVANAIRQNSRKTKITDQDNLFNEEV